MYVLQIGQFVIHTTFCFGTILDLINYLFELLKLKLTINHLMLFNHGCHVVGLVLHEVKAIVQNNLESCVPVVCVETMLTSFYTPTESNVDALIGHTLFGDGATHGEEEDGETKKVNQMKRIR